jgi:hypothetical protein
VEVLQLLPTTGLAGWLCATKMPLLLITLLLCSCSPRPANNTGLPDYSDMSAAEDAGKAK